MFCVDDIQSGGNVRVDENRQKHSFVYFRLTYSHCNETMQSCVGIMYKLPNKFLTVVTIFTLITDNVERYAGARCIIILYYYIVNSILIIGFPS